MSAGLADVLFVLTVALYSIGTVRFGMFMAGYGGQEVGRLGPIALALGAVTHALHICVFSLVLHICPVEGIHFPLSVASMLMCVGYLVLRRRTQMEAVGAVVAPLALSALLASRFVGGGALAPGPKIRSAILPFHVTMNLLGVALFTLASGAAVLYLIQEGRIKSKQLSGMSTRLPPLDALDKAEHRFLLLGFPMLTLGVVSGTVWAPKFASATTADLIRTALGYGTWGLIALVLLSRATLGWRGKRAAWGTLAGYVFALLVLSMYLLRTSGGSG